MNPNAVSDKHAYDIIDAGGSSGLNSSAEMINEAVYLP